ncbi:MAG: hypothetical protein E7L01_29960 [Paenibacillus macerans]|uniref:hypothetical protein n=2 Tax=Paenibacillus macerans TaxID=44252 RepID=UPI00055C6C0D|nr:hypothetical protein [Paenibacillus macerans]MCY7562007.1 hypothetical protein [Paenibacillus macerans]MDU7477529.1 hypothetical protein [Paenibacillus macerans]MEC0135887.1 hypothetical protein [Paenibacillus macerans]MEC0153872.1 hypothetical protein [Paenibacillus macerans]SUA83344.1 Uncharacterised protein [Paenibacillus macerans]
MKRKKKKVKVKQFIPTQMSQSPLSPTLFNPGPQLPGIFGPSQPSSGPPASSGFGSLFKGLGGLDGILGTLGKVQKMVGMFRQFYPLIKLFFPKAATASVRNGGTPRRRAVKQRTINKRK